ncbi:NRDE family protein [Candidatus Binatia bacterium]|nr:NRDE family protein [Candidatus Binatia bacterium]
MCTLAVFTRTLPGLPLVVAANRDEFYARPAEGPRVLTTDPCVVGGRDVVAGGSWLATSEHRLVVGILNRRTGEPPDPSRASRGALCVTLAQLRSVQEAVDLLSRLRVDEHNPFNVLVADRARAVVAQNRADGMALQELPPGTHLLTNLDLNDATCQRISRSSQRFQDLATRFADTRDRSDLVAGLHAVLGDHLTAVDDRAPTDQLCIHTEAFGTRSSSIVLADEHGRVEYLHASAAPCRGAYRRIPLPWQ